jgi:hypothetical protein
MTREFRNGFEYACAKRAGCGGGLRPEDVFNSRQPKSSRVAIALAVTIDHSTRN